MFSSLHKSLNVLEAFTFDEIPRTRPVRAHSYVGIRAPASCSPSSAGG